MKITFGWEELVEDPLTGTLGTFSSKTILIDKDHNHMSIGFLFIYSPSCSGICSIDQANLEYLPQPTEC